MTHDSLLIQITDTHLFADPAARLGGVATRASFEGVMRAVVREPAAAMLLTGDLAERGEPAAYAALREACDALGVPRHALAGNHDAPDVLAAALASPGAFSLGAWRVVMLETHWPGHEGGWLAETETAHLARELAAHRGRPILIAMHHPPLSIGSPWLDPMGLANADAFWPHVERAPDVRAVIFGHVHQNFDSHRGTARVLATPSTCVQFMPRATRFECDPRPPGYRRLWLGADGGLRTEVVRVAW